MWLAGVVTLLTLRFQVDPWTSPKKGDLQQPLEKLSKVSDRRKPNAGSRRSPTQALFVAENRSFQWFQA